MLMIEKLKEAMEATRCKGNTTFLLESSLGTDTQVIMDSQCTADLFSRDGYKNAKCLRNFNKSKAFALDNSVVMVAVEEALEYIERLEATQKNTLTGRDAVKYLENKTIKEDKVTLELNRFQTLQFMEILGDVTEPVNSHKGQVAYKFRDILLNKINEVS
jgi:hypothetical protein